ncbi:Ovostatin-like [Mactra antiquata]
MNVPKNEQDTPHYWGHYILIIKGQGVLTFENATYIRQSHRVPDKDDYLFIQTDKAVYKTGQTVKYRVFLLDNEMKPKEGEYDVSIYDAFSNTIKVEHGKHGLFGTSGELQLSEQPTIGLWKIKAQLKNSDVSEIVYFTVDIYELPTFEVNVELPSFGTVDKPQLKGKVTAKYTYGKPVKGHVTLTVSKSNSYWKFYEPKAIQTEFKIDGEADFSIATNTLLKFDPSLKSDSLKVVAEVKEEETRETRSGESYIDFHERPIKIEFHTHNDVFKPGFKYSTYMKVTQPDGRPLTSYGERVKIGVTYLTDKKTTNLASVYQVPQSPSSNLMKFLSPFPGGDVIFMPDMYLPIPGSGMIKLDLEVPDNVATGHIDVQLKDVKVSKNIQRFRTISKAYLNLEMKSANVQVGKQAEFSLRSNIKPSGKITYHIIKDCRILETHYTYISSAYQKNYFYITMTAEMVPMSQILAYFYDDEHGEIIADSIQFDVQTTFKNEVILRFDRGQVSPGDNVTLVVQADPQSQVYVLAVDKSVLLQTVDAKNDITKETVRNRYGVYNRPRWIYQDSFLFKRMSANDPKGVFQQSCLEPISDGLLYDFDLWSTQSSSMDFRSGDINEIGYGGAVFANHVHDINTVGPMSRTRSNFPETWIWSNASVDSTGNVGLSVTVPDTITDWIATGYALNKNSGLGVASDSANLTAYLPFFVSLHFPNHVVKNEIAVIQALVFNYYTHDLYVTVTLKNASKEFVSLEIDKYGNERDTGDILQKCILVKANDVESAYFPVMPLKTGSIDIEVEAQCSRGKDTIKRQLIVKPPGIQEAENHPVMLTANGGDISEAILPIIYPINVVPGSQRIQVTVTGDIFGPSMNHLDKLIKMPYGCGEQNMVRFAPAVYAAQYLLKVNKQLDDSLGRKIKLYLEKGYQRQLTYKRYDGSFSTFGNRDDEGSVWLTAFVLKSFAQASKFTYIEQSVMEKGLRFVFDQQNTDGSFNKAGFVHNKAMMGDTAGSTLSLTAYIVTALHEIHSTNLLENKTLVTELKDRVLKALTFLDNSKNEISSDYDLAITAYASTALNTSNLTESLMRRLESSARFVTSGSMKYWQHQSRSVEVEIAAYALLVYSHLQDNVRGYHILEWIVDRRSPYGGYVSTQDTVVALQSLSSVAAQTYSTDIDMTIFVDYGGNNNKSVKINSDNMDVLQYVDIPAETTSLLITANGNGTGLVEVGTFFNVINDENHPSIDLEVTTNTSSIDRYNLTACARWLGSDESGMILIEFNFPSGYKLAPEQYPDYDDVLRPSKTENKNGQFVAYYDKLSRESACYQISVIRDSMVGKIQSAAVKVYSYYNPEISAQRFYTLDVPNKSLCDYCGFKCGCGYNPDAVPETRCPGIIRNYHQPVFRTIAPVIPNFPTWTKTVKTSRILNPIGRDVSRFINGQPVQSGPYHVTKKEVIAPDSDIVHRQKLDPNRWHRGQPIPVSTGVRRTVRRNYPQNLMSGSIPVVRRQWTVNQG